MHVAYIHQTVGVVSINAALTSDFPVYSNIPDEEFIKG